MPIITSVALTIATTDWPSASSRRSADSFVMAATTVAPLTSIVLSPSRRPATRTRWFRSAGSSRWSPCGPSLVCGSTLTHERLRTPAQVADPVPRRRHLAITTMHGCSSSSLCPHDRPRSVRGVPQGGHRVKHRWCCSGAVPDRVAMSTTGGAAQDGPYREGFATLPFPVP
jgi:hypothetical protein